MTMNCEADVSGNYPEGVHDSDFNDDPDGLDAEEEDDDPEYWTCAFPDKCLMPSFPHTRDECYTVEDAEDYYRNEEGIENL